MCDSWCSGLPILSDDHLRYDTNGNYLLESEEIAQIPPCEQSLNLFTDPYRSIPQEESDVVCAFLSLDLLSQLRTVRNGNFEQLSSFCNILRSSHQEKAIAFADFISANDALFSEGDLIDVLLRSAELVFARASNEQELLDAILKDLPQVLAVGEAHPDASDPITTARLFADRILPLLKVRYGYDVLVLELVTADLPSAELDYYMEYGIVDDERTPSLSASARMLKGKSSEDLLYILKRCGELGIDVRGGSPSLNDIMTRNGPDFAYEIRDRSAQAIEAASMSGHKVIWYGGFIHNDIDGEHHLSFVPFLSRRDGLVELDLIGTYNGDDGLYDYLDRISREELLICPNEDDPLMITVSPGAHVIVYSPDMMSSF